MQSFTHNCPKGTLPPKQDVTEVLQTYKFVQLADFLQVLSDTLQYHLKEQPHVLREVQEGPV